MTESLRGCIESADSSIFLQNSVNSSLFILDQGLKKQLDRQVNRIIRKINNWFPDCETSCIGHRGGMILGLSEFAQSQGLELEYILRELHLSTVKVPVLDKAILSRVNLISVDLSGANLSSLKLWGADLSGADLNHANLRNTKLMYADLQFSNLVNCNFRRADMTGVNLANANLTGANLKEVILEAAQYTVETNGYPNYTQFPSGFDPEKYGMLKLER